MTDELTHCATSQCRKSRVGISAYCYDCTQHNSSLILSFSKVCGSCQMCLAGPARNGKALCEVCWRVRGSLKGE